MSLHFEAITAKNRNEAELLQISSAQQGFVESVHDSLIEADNRNFWKPVGIYNGEQLIGFAMYGFFWADPPSGRVWLDRLLIDFHHQRKGYGKAALLALLERLHKQYQCEKVYLSVFEDNVSAIKLYTDVGFVFNGELDIHGEKVMVYSF